MPAGVADVFGSLPVWMQLVAVSAAVTAVYAAGYLEGADDGLPELLAALADDDGGDG